MSDQPDTKERILNAAEVLFAEHGFTHTSTRRITRTANVNLAAVNYHFGSKDQLIKAVFNRRIKPVNVERLRRLTALEKRGDPTLEQVLGAFIAPLLELGQGDKRAGDLFVRLIGRSYTDHTAFLRDYMHELNADLNGRFKTAFSRALAHLPPKELAWRLHFLVGSVSYVMAGPDLIRLMAGCRISEPDNAKAVLARLIPFLAGGLSASLPDDMPELRRRSAGFALA